MPFVIVVVRLPLVKFVLSGFLIIHSYVMVPLPLPVIVPLLLVVPFLQIVLGLKSLMVTELTSNDGGRVIVTLALGLEETFPAASFAHA